MKGKKIIGLMLCLSVYAVMALGSGSSSSNTKEVTQTSDDVSESTESTSDTENSGAMESSETIGNGTTIEEQVLLDQDGIKITATDYVNDDLWGDSISLLVENTSTKDYTITCDALIVNDYMITDLFYCDIAAGKKANEDVNLYTSELNAAGIDTVGKVEIYFRAYDSSYDVLFDQVYAEIQTSDYENYDNTPSEGGTELYNANGIRIVGQTVDENSFWGTSILLYCENNSGQNVGISVEDMSVNGYMMDALYSATIYDGKKSIDDITLFSSDLEKNGISSIDEAELKFHIYNIDSYATIDDSEAITFSAQ